MSFQSAQGQLNTSSFKAVSLPVTGLISPNVNNLMYSVVLPVGVYVVTTSVPFQVPAITSAINAFILYSGATIATATLADMTATAIFDPTLNITALFESDGVSSLQLVTSITGTPDSYYITTAYPFRTVRIV